MNAPFSAEEAAHVLGTLAAIAIAFGGIGLMIVGPGRFVRRALLIGVALAIMSGGAAAIFQ